MGLELGPAGVSGAQRQLLYEAVESGIRDGFTVPIHDRRGPIAAVTFTANVRNTTAFRRRVDEHKRVLQLMGCISMRTLVASLFPLDRLIRESAWTPNDRLD